MAGVEARSDSVRPNNRIVFILLGIALLLPTVLACGASQLLLSVGTFITSLQKTSLAGVATNIGMKNYERLFQDEIFLGAAKFSLATVAVQVLLVAVLPLLLAWGASVLGRKMQAAMRLIFTVPVVIFVPVATAVIWGLIIGPTSGIYHQYMLAQKAQAKLVLLLITGIYTLGLACGVGLTFYLAAFRKSGGDKIENKPWKPLLVSWSVGLLATIAFSLQSFALNYTLTSGGPDNATTNLVLYLYKSGFIFMQFGYASAQAGVMLVVLAVLGLAAGLIVVISNVKIQLLPKPGSEDASGSQPAGNQTLKILAIVALVLGLLSGLAAIVLGVLPILLTISAASGGANSSSLQTMMPFGRTLVNSVLPPLISILIQTLLAFLGAFGIGALRPMGRRSEWLLLPFFPWLFVGVVPLGISAFQILQKLGQINTFGSLIPPMALSIPTLVLLTLLFKGQEARWPAGKVEGETGFRRLLNHFFLPSLPWAVLLSCINLFATLIDPYWPLMMAIKPEMRSFDVSLLAISKMYSNLPALSASAAIRVLLPTSFFFLFVFALFQFLFLGRLSISAGKDNTTG